MSDFFESIFLGNSKINLLNRPILQQLAMDLTNHFINLSELLSTAVAQLNQFCPLINSVEMNKPATINQNGKKGLRQLVL